MIDTHCHLLKEFYENIDLVIKNMGNNIMIVSGTNNEDNKEVIELCNKYPNVFGTLGIHPTEINKIDDNSFNFIEDNLSNPKIVGIGEIGLDYHWNTNISKQKEVFIKQLELAKKYKKCVVIHSRDAIKETYDILKEHAIGLKIVIHCFSSSLEMAKEFIKINCRLGIGGVVTFKNSNKLKEVVEVIPLEYLLLETDSPFLSPEPNRGKTNEPYNIIYVAEEIAKIKTISLEEVLKITTSNSISQFDLDLNL